MRRDYYNLCSEFPELYQRLEADDRRARYLVERMRDEDLRRIVTEPLTLAGVEEAARQALARSVLQDVGERPGDLALLQFALTESWRQRKEHGGDLLRSYVSVGRVEGALAGAAERVYEEVLRGNTDTKKWTSRRCSSGWCGSAIRVAPLGGWRGGANLMSGAGPCCRSSPRRRATALS